MYCVLYLYDVSTLFLALLKWFGQIWNGDIINPFRDWNRVGKSQWAPWGILEKLKLTRADSQADLVNNYNVAWIKGILNFDFEIKYQLKWLQSEVVREIGSL